MPHTPAPPITRVTPSMRIKYSVSRWDLFRWQLYVALRARVFVLLALLISGTFVWRVMNENETATMPLGAKIASGLIVGGLMLVFLWLLLILRLLFTMLLDVKKGMLGEHEMEIRDDGLLERAGNLESIHRWSDLEKVVTTNNYIYIYAHDARPRAHIVPRRGPSSETDILAFRDAVEQRIESAEAVRKQ